MLLDDEVSVGEIFKKILGLKISDKVLYQWLKTTQLSKILSSDGNIKTYVGSWHRRRWGGLGGLQPPKC